ncbi:PREDICTED: uncharacterized protein LOC107070059 [Polistes dominula]|uniref:Uncharacterized protein LOC107070059 n=1 Tax=Polistes dominula TaxID=743375 RepID=A0ABM1IT51_POLDO|nr:PREDICTED: uncharacterized protein LOC107070059 [Polistes dominula]
MVVLTTLSSLVILHAIVTAVSSNDRETRVKNDHFHGGISHTIQNRQVVWPHWFRERQSRLQDRKHEWNHFESYKNDNNYNNDDDVETTIAVAPTIGGTSSIGYSSFGSIVRPNATTRSDKFGAIAVAEYSGTRAIAYAGFHDDHRHHSYPETPVTRGYQRILTTTPATYTRHHSGRRVCARQTTSSSPHHHHGKQIRFVYTEVSRGFMCCPGWMQFTRFSYGCNKPTCSPLCLNGGTCISPGRCICPKGFTGSQCQSDVDECVTEKPCGQLCRNLPGSYECYCRPGFHLQQDGQSCRRNGTEDTAFEARDLENDFHESLTSTSTTTTSTTRKPTTTSSSHDVDNEVGDVDLDQDYEIIMRRLTKLEKQVAKNKKRETESTDMSARITMAVESINDMRRAVENVQLMQQEIYDMRNKMKHYELEARKVQHLTNRVTDLESRLRTRCRPSLTLDP